MSNNDPENECILCRIGKDTRMDRENFVLYRQDGFYVVLNRFPYINGHLMIAPLRHAENFGSLSEQELICIFGLIVKCEKALVQGMKCLGINGGWNLGSCAGAGIEGHVHIHMLPRWSGDVNFMTTTAGTRVISASLEDSYNRLKPYFEGGDN